MNFLSFSISNSVQIVSSHFCLTIWILLSHRLLCSNVGCFQGCPWDLVASWFSRKKSRVLESPWKNCWNNAWGIYVGRENLMHSFCSNQWSLLFLTHYFVVDLKLFYKIASNPFSVRPWQVAIASHLFLGQAARTGDSCWILSNYWHYFYFFCSYFSKPTFK